MESLILHQLPLAKFMFDRAEKEAVSNHPFSAGLAVSLLQDAVELGAAAACGQQGLKMPKAFLEFWKLPELRLVEFACMQRLNCARVSFKHLGNQPSRDAFIDFRAPALRVLDYISERFFSLDFASVSLADGVANRKTRERFKRAEGYLAAGNSRDAASSLTTGMSHW